MLKCNKPFTVSSIPQIIDLAFYDIKSVEIRTLSSTVFSIKIGDLRSVSYTHLTLPPKA